MAWPISYQENGKTLKSSLGLKLNESATKSESTKHGQYLHPASQGLIQGEQKKANEELSFLGVLTLLLTQNL